MVLTRLKPSCPKHLGWTKLDKTSKFNSYSSLTVLSKFCPSYIQVLSRFCPSFVQILSKLYPSFVQVLSRFCPSFVQVLSSVVRVFHDKSNTKYSYGNKQALARKSIHCPRSLSILNCFVPTAMIYSFH